MSNTTRRAGLGLQQAQEDSEKIPGATEDLVFRPGINKKWQNKEQAVSFCILPAIPILPDGTPDKENYLSYRDSNFHFTEWLTVFKQHRGFCKTMDVVGAKVLFGPDAVDPIDLIWDTANDDERFFGLISKDRNTRKIESDAYMTALIRRPEWRALVNVIDPFDREHPNKVSLMIMSKTAVVKNQYRGFPERFADYKEGGHYKVSNSTWGLCESLDKLRDRPENVLPGIQPGTPPDFNNIFYEGDVTDISRMAVCQVQRELPPQGGIRTYNCTVSSLGRVAGNMEQLRGRYDFGTEVFVDISYPELLDKVAKALIPVSKKLLYKAWADRGPEFNAALSRNSVASGVARAPGVDGISRTNLDDPTPAPQQPSAPQQPVTSPPPQTPAATPPVGSPPPAQSAPVPTPPQGLEQTAPPAPQAPSPLPPATSSGDGGDRRSRLRDALGDAQ